MMRTRTMLLVAALVLGACGKRQPLQPAIGRVLPVKPATAPAQPTADQLLASTPQMRPGRSDELLTKSAVRSDDHFDLPPR